MERVGVCIGCHRDIPDGNIFVSLISKTGDILGMLPHSDKEHSDLINRDINLAAITKLLTVLLIGLLFLAAVVYFRRRKKKTASARN